MSSTAVLLVDPYNDFLSKGGKLYPLLQGILEEDQVLEHLRTLRAAARAAGVPIVVAPHHRASPGDLSAWRYPTPWQVGASKHQTFARGTWGGEWHPDLAPEEGDLVASEHLAANAFHATDLDVQLRQRGIERLVLVGLMANTCLEATGRAATELGYHVTLVRDATAAFDRARMTSAHELNGPTYAHAIVTTAELLAAAPFAR